MRVCWVVLGGVLIAGCGNGPVPNDHGRMFLGDWQCTSGTRQIDCGQGVQEVNLALVPSKLARFGKGAQTDLLLLIPSSALVPGDPDRPICELAFDGNDTIASLHAESTCLDDAGQSIVVRSAEAHVGWSSSDLSMGTSSMTSQGCNVRTDAVCHFVQ